jgi:hypothetical protein
MLRTVVPCGARREMGRLRRPPAEHHRFADGQPFRQRRDLGRQHACGWQVRGCAGQGAACARAVRPPQSGLSRSHYATSARCRSTSGCGSRRGWMRSTSMRSTSRTTSAPFSPVRASSSIRRSFKRCLRPCYNAVMKAKKRPYWHLFEDVTVLDSDGGAAKIRAVVRAVPLPR